MPKPNLLWSFVPYIIVFLGLVIFHNAFGALVGFHLSLVPIIARDPSQKISLFYKNPITTMKMMMIYGIMGLVAGLGLWIYITLGGLQADFRSNIKNLGLSINTWLFFIFYFTLFNPPFEELYWRHSFYRLGNGVDWIDFLYAGYHLIILFNFVSVWGMAFMFIVLAGVSWFWRQISYYTNSLLPATISHMAADLSIILVIFHFAN